ncbi:hypothetical protein DH09_05855 [Bacillaceae bacterium JMAK1]|nr:hypothetical protein DH09_05855 [Bacillaceae bacterium JMAK1]
MQIKDHNEWLYMDEVMRSFKKDDMYFCEFGITYIHPDDVIALSHRKVLRQQKLDRLKEAYKRHGEWYDDPSDPIALLLLPDGRFGIRHGNHRIYLAKKQNIKKVRALVDIFIPKSLIPAELQCYIQTCEQEIATLKRNMKNIDHLLRAQPLSNESLVIERKLLKTAYNKQVQKLNDRLLEEATKLQLIPIKS